MRKSNLVAIQWETSVADINQFGCRQKPNRNFTQSRKGTQRESEKKFDYTEPAFYFFPDLFVQNRLRDWLCL